MVRGISHTSECMHVQAHTHLVRSMYTLDQSNLLDMRHDMHQRLVVVGSLVRDGQPVTYLEQNVGWQSHRCQCEADVEHDRMNETPSKRLLHALNRIKTRISLYPVSCDDSL